MKRKTNFKWVIKIVLFSVIVSMVFSFVSAQVLGNAGYVVAFLVLIFFIFLGVVFDIIGVSVTVADPVPFHSMASHRERGAAEALRLIRHSEKVASFCNDVVGDISGIVSGATSAAIVANLMRDLSTENIFLQLIVSGCVAGLTIGGKALGKTVAINNSTKIVFTVGRLMSIRGKRNTKK